MTDGASGVGATASVATAPGAGARAPGVDVRVVVATARADPNWTVWAPAVVAAARRAPAGPAGTVRCAAGAGAGARKAVVDPAQHGAKQGSKARVAMRRLRSESAAARARAASRGWRRLHTDRRAAASWFRRSPNSSSRRSSAALAPNAAQSAIRPACRSSATATLRPAPGRRPAAWVRPRCRRHLATAAPSGRHAGRRASSRLDASLRVTRCHGPRPRLRRAHGAAGRPAPDPW